MTGSLSIFTHDRVNSTERCIIVLRAVDFMALRNIERTDTSAYIPLLGDGNEIRCVTEKLL